MPDKPSTVSNLEEQVRTLQRLQDESAWNETALIATLQELVPGFAPRFAQLRIAVETMTSPQTSREMQRLVEAMKKAKQ